MQDALRLRAGRFALTRQRERLQLNVSQDLPGQWGSLYLSGSATRYWDRPGQVLQLQAGYNNTAKVMRSNLNYGLSYVHQRDDRTGQTDERLLLSLSMGLGSRPDGPQLSASIARQDSGGEVDMTGQVSLAGTLRAAPRPPATAGRTSWAGSP